MIMGRLSRFSSKFSGRSSVRQTQNAALESRKRRAAPGALKDGSALVMNTFERSGRKAGFVNAKRIRKETGLIFSPIAAAVILFLYFLLVPMNYTRSILTTRPLRSSTPCYGEQPTVCDPSPPLKYYIWNLTNPEQVMSGTEAPALEQVGPYAIQVFSKNFNVNFSLAGEDVSFSTFSWTEFAKNASCPTCSENDIFTTVNPAYLSILATMGGSEYGLLFGSMPMVFQGVSDILSGVIKGMMNSTVAPFEDVVGQWANCSALSGLSVSEVVPDYSLMDPNVPEFCAYARIILGLPSELATLPAELAAGVFRSLMLPETAGMFALSTHEDPALLALLEVPEMQQPHFEMIQGYIFYLAGTYGKAGLQAILGPALGPASGGLFVARPVKSWLMEGWVDPLLGLFMGPTNPLAKVCLGMPGCLTGEFELEEMFGVSIGELTPQMHMAVAELQLNTGASDSATATQLMQLNGLGQMYNARGESRNLTGQMFPTQNPKFDESEAIGEMYHLDSFREMQFEFSGKETEFKGQPTLRFHPMQEWLKPCGVSEVESRCFFDDNFHGVFNMTFLYLAETILTSPHFFGADPALMRLLDPAEEQFTEDAEAFGWYIDYFARTGIPYKINTPVQRSHLVKATDVLYPEVWASNSSALRGGMMLPLIWTASGFELPGSLLDLLVLTDQLFGYLYLICMALPAVLIIIWGITLYLSYFTPSARHNVAVLEDLRSRKSPPNVLAEVDAEQDAKAWWFNKAFDLESNNDRQGPALAGFIGAGGNGHVSFAATNSVEAGEEEQVLTINITSTRNSKKAKSEVSGNVPSA